MSTSAIFLVSVLSALQLLLLWSGLEPAQACFVATFGAVLAPLYSGRVHQFYRQAFLVGQP